MMGASYHSKFWLAAFDQRKQMWDTAEFRLFLEIHDKPEYYVIFRVKVHIMWQWCLDHKKFGNKKL